MVRAASHRERSSFQQHYFFAVCRETKSCVIFPIMSKTNLKCNFWTQFYYHFLSYIISLSNSVQSFDKINHNLSCFIFLSKKENPSKSWKIINNNMYVFLLIERLNSQRSTQVDVKRFQGFNDLWIHCCRMTFTMLFSSFTDYT